MLIAFSPNGNSFLTSESRVYPPFFLPPFPTALRFLTYDTSNPAIVRVEHAFAFPFAFASAAGRLLFRLLSKASRTSDYGSEFIFKLNLIGIYTMPDNQGSDRNNEF